MFINYNKFALIYYSLIVVYLFYFVKYSRLLVNVLNNSNKILAKCLLLFFVIFSLLFFIFSLTSYLGRDSFKFYMVLLIGAFSTLMPCNAFTNK